MGVSYWLRVSDCINCFLLKVLGILKGLLQKSLKRVKGRALALSYAPYALPKAKAFLLMSTNLGLTHSSMATIHFSSGMWGK